MDSKNTAKVHHDEFKKNPLLTLAQANCEIDALESIFSRFSMKIYTIMPGLDGLTELKTYSWKEA